MLKKLLLTTLLSISVFGVEIVIDETFDSGFNSKDIVNDKTTNLSWQDDKDAKTVKKDWDEAKKYCQDLELQGYSDWHLPSKQELESIIDKTNSQNMKVGFNNIVSDYLPKHYWYWSSTSYPTYTNYAWHVNFGNGYTSRSDKGDNLSVRCVRIGQYNILDFENLISKLTEAELKNIPKPPSELQLKKDEFETTSEFNQRVKETKKKQKLDIANYKKKYSSSKLAAKQKAIKKALQYTWGKPLLTNLKYDADNGYFIADISFEIKKDFKKKIAIKVKRKNARNFKKDFDSLKPQAIFDYDGSSVKLKDIKVPYKSHDYIALFTDMSVDDAVVAVNITNDIDVDNSFSSSVTVAKSDVSTLDSSKFNNFNELDNLLKKSKQVKTDKTKWLFVVGIEKYDYTDNIIYAKRSAEMFVKTAQKRLGVPPQNSFVMINSQASQAKIKTSMKKLLRRVKSGDTIYFYYNGHGVPVPSLKNAPYLLTADTEPDFVADEKFFSLQNIYTKLSDSKADKVIAVVDSCFSGVTDGKAVLKGVAATKMVAKSVKFDKEKMVVLSAGKSNQYSNGYDKKAHRLFSFFILKNIIEGEKSVKTLFKDTKAQTYDTSLEEYGDVRVQEPTVEGNFRLLL